METDKFLGPFDTANRASLQVALLRRKQHMHLGKFDPASNVLTCNNRPIIIIIIIFIIFQPTSEPQYAYKIYDYKKQTIRLFPNLLRNHSLNISFDFFIKNGSRIRIPRQKVCLC